MPGSMTAGVQAGIAAYQNSVRIKQLKDIADRQQLLHQAGVLKDVTGMPPGPVRQLAISKILAPMGFDEESVKALSKANDEEFQSLGEAMNNLLVDHPELGASTLRAALKSGKLDIGTLWKMGQDSAKAKNEAKVQDLFAPSPDTSAPAEAPATPAMPDTQLRTGPSGVDLGMPPDAPAMPQAQIANAPPQVQPGPKTPEEQLAALGVAEEGLSNSVQKSLQFGGLSPQMKAGVDAHLAGIEKRRSAIMDQIKQANPNYKETQTVVNGRPMRVFVDEKNPQAPPIPIGPVVQNAQSEVGKIQADRQALIDQGAGVGSPAVKAMDRQIEALGTGDDKTAQSPIGKAIDDYARAVRIYGEGSPQAAAVKTVVDQMKGQGQVTQSDVGNMRHQFTQASTRFISVRDAISQIESSAKKPSNIGDLGVMTGYMKLIDPGSTVRENEMANAKNAAAVPERIRAIWNNLQGGGQLSTKTRAEFVSKARDIYAGYTRNQQALVKQYEGIATKQGIDPSQVVIDFINSSGGTTSPDLPAAKQDTAKAAKDLLEANKPHVDALNEWLRKNK